MTSIALEDVDSPDVELISSRYCHFVGVDLSVLQEMERISSTLVVGCRVCLNWPEEFPNKLLVQVSDRTIPQVNINSNGSVTLNLGSDSDTETRVEWLMRGLISQFGSWKGIDTPPPLWLLHAAQLMGIHQMNPQMRTLLLRGLQGQKIPSLAQRIQTYDLTSDTTWDFLVYRFLESGGLSVDVLKQRLEQFWANGYDWTQLSLFFVPRYTDLNGAELELLWKTFVGETLVSESAFCLSEEASLSALDTLSKIEVLKNNELQVLASDTWYLYRNDSVARQMFSQKQAELEVLARSVHPYYFNACHSLDRVFFTMINEDLEGYRGSIRQWNQDMLDAQQLTFETDRLLKKMCPE